LSRLCGDPPGEAFLIEETGTEAGPWFAIANELVGIVVEELGSDAIEKVMREIDRALR
jgi:hypothetical protein